MWSLGVILYRLCTLDYPFNPGNDSEAALANLVINEKYKDIPDCYSDSMKKLVKALLMKNPDERPNINKIMGHPSIRN